MPADNQESGEHGKVSTENLWREYESCQRAAQNVEPAIWQTGAVMALGSVGAFIAMSNRAQPPWFVVVIACLLIIVVNIIWWLMARRWWSVQHAMFWRMRHIAKKLEIHGLLYLAYLDDPKRYLRDPDCLPDSLSSTEQADLNKLTKGCFFCRPHQRCGVQKCLKWFLVINILLWVIYGCCSAGSGWLALGCHARQPSPVQAFDKARTSYRVGQAQR